MLLLFYHDPLQVWLMLLLLHHELLQVWLMLLLLHHDPLQVWLLLLLSLVTVAAVLLLTIRVGKGMSWLLPSLTQGEISADHRANIERQMSSDIFSVFPEFYSLNLVLPHTRHFVCK